MTTLETTTETTTTAKRWHRWGWWCRRRLKPSSKQCFDSYINWVIRIDWLDCCWLIVAVAFTEPPNDEWFSVPSHSTVDLDGMPRQVFFLALHLPFACISFFCSAKKAKAIAEICHFYRMPPHSMYFSHFLLGITKDIRRCCLFRNYQILFEFDVSCYRWGGFLHIFIAHNSAPSLLKRSIRLAFLFLRCVWAAIRQIL